jgi:hypothetical protein
MNEELLLAGCEDIVAVVFVRTDIAGCELRPQYAALVNGNRRGLGSGQIKVQEIALASGQIRRKLKTNPGEKIAGQS